MPHSADSLQDWLVSNRLYEDNLFYYALIIGFWFFVGLFTLDFNIAGFSSEQVWFLLVCGAFFFPLFWYRLVFGSNFFLLEEKRQIQDKLDSIADDIVYKNNIKMGVSPPNRLEVSCLGLLFSFLLFDIFYREVWVSDQLALV